MSEQKERLGIKDLAERLKQPQALTVEQDEWRRHRQALGETKTDLEETIAKLNSLAETVPVKLSDFNLIDKTFTANLLETLRDNAAMYLSAVNQVLKESEDLNQTFEKIVRMLEDVLYVAGKNKDLEREVLQKLKTELDR